MRKSLFLILSVLLFHVTVVLDAQDLQHRKEVTYIDSVLNRNPYFEGFLGITYYYSIDITPQNELVVIMDFKGPFTTIFKAKVSDLQRPFIADTTEYTSAVCWQCKPDQDGKEKRCISQINTYTSGEKDVVDSDDICIQLPTQPELRLDLMKRIEDLVNGVAEE
jgi:hypothetical protein